MNTTAGLLLAILLPAIPVLLWGIAQATMASQPFPPVPRATRIRRAMGALLIGGGLTLLALAIVVACLLSGLHGEGQACSQKYASREGIAMENLEEGR